MIARVHKGLQGITCKGGYTKIYRGLQGIMGVFKLRIIEDYRGIRGSVQGICRGMERFTWVYKDIHGFTGVIQGYTRVYSIPVNFF